VERHYLKTLAEIGMVLALSEQVCRSVNGGRLKNMFTKLKKTMVKEIRDLPHATPADAVKIQAIVEDFGQLSGWEKSQRHIMTHVAFLLLMLEESRHQYRQESFNLLNAIVNYFERVGDHQQSCDNDGVAALKKWRGVGL
jgi:hypothetical protein